MIPLKRKARKEARLTRRLDRQSLLRQLFELALVLAVTEVLRDSDEWDLVEDDSLDLCSERLW